jgi:lipopolysaccharide/colanic/teichoic acid biosynthesis glycosyltransferase
VHGSGLAADAVPPKAGIEGRRYYAVPVLVDAEKKGHWLSECAYWVFEKTFAAFALVLSLPVMAFEAVIIKLDSPGPALFVHTRVCRSAVIRGRELRNRSDLRTPNDREFDPDGLYWVPSTFRLMKFRTMYHDALARFPEFYNLDYGQEEFYKRPFKIDNDPRVTRIGWILRRLTIDELPNFLSVLKGEMRLVGPRPEHPDLLRYYSAAEMYKFSVKPGITGLAQVRGRGLLSQGQTIEYDLEYVRNRSISLDLKILIQTIVLVLTRRGAF